MMNMLEMETERRQRSAIWVTVFAVIGSVLVGVGANWLIGAGVFFLMWALAGLLGR